MLWLGADSPWWGVTLGIVAFLASQAVIGLKMRKQVAAVMQGVQTILQEGQKRVQEKIARWRIRPPGNIKAAQAEIARDQKQFFTAAIEATEELRKFKRWMPMMERQIATAQFQLYWNLKDFAKVDELMGKAFLADPMMKAMKLARMFTKGAETAEMARFYEKSVKRGAYNANVILAAAWSWMLVQRKDIDGAFKVLTEALKNSDNATLKANHVNLMNNRPTHFSNSGLGEQWYALFLEEPRIRQERPRMQWR